MGRSAGDWFGWLASGAMNMAASNTSCVSCVVEWEEWHGAAAFVLPLAQWGGMKMPLYRYGTIYEYAAEKCRDFRRKWTRFCI